MSTKPKILFVFDHPKPDWWMDGLWAALNLLEEDFEIDKYNLGGDLHVNILPNSHDFELGWGAFGSRVDQYLQDRAAVRKHMVTKGVKTPITSKAGLCIAGNAIPPNGANSYDVLFYETKWYRPTLDNHPHARRAFGINSDLFCPATISTPVVWDYIGVGAFAAWKRWEKMADKPGRKLVVGEYQLNNEQESLNIVRHLVSQGIMVSGQVSPLDLVNLYHWSRILYMPSDVYGGGERAVLEARACGLAIEVEDDNPKLKELLEGPIPSHHDYAAALKKGIMECLGS